MSLGMARFYTNAAGEAIPGSARASRVTPVRLGPMAPSPSRTFGKDCFGGGAETSTRGACAPQIQISILATRFLERLDFFFQDGRDAMPRQINLADADVELDRDFLGRPILAHITIEDLELLRLDFLFHAR